MSKVFTITTGLENMGAMKTGGQGSVYKGKRIGEIITAIKLLPTPIHSESPEDKNFKAFSNEVEKLKKVNENPNPNVVKILSSGITDTGNLPFIEMEFIEGPDLEDLLKAPNDPLFTLKEFVKVANHLSNALAHCHKLGIKHGDIKSNNVKFNIHTGNYMLLDFGLAVMSDEQRRTSLRHAGAIEFMAPEQAEGQSLFETDVYSFGIVLFELLAGTVPFPLTDKGETGRNKIMVAHMEKPVPDVLRLRRERLPVNWSGEKKEKEMQVPGWMVKLIYKCLEKNPGDRFANGDQLHDFIWTNLGGYNTVPSVSNSNFLEQENRKLKLENEQLQQKIQSLQKDATVTSLANAKPVSPPASASDSAEYYAAYHKKSSANTWIYALLILAGLGALTYYLINKNATPSETSTASKNEPVTTPNRNRALVAEYKVIVPRAYFHDEPDDNTRRNAYAVPSDSTVKAMDDRNGFIYTEIRNSRNQLSKGWLRKEDLISAQLANQNQITPPIINNNLNDEDVKAQLRTAEQLVNSGKILEALPIYENLLDQQVPEAMFQYANLALKDENDNIDCKQAFDLLTQAGNKGHILSKRTLGFLYSFADDRYVLEENNYYERCTIPKNAARGSQLLIEAMVAGDSIAAQYVRDLNVGQ